MDVNIKQLGLPGVYVIEPVCFEDLRGFFLETFHQQKYEAAGIARTFVQDNLSHSSRGVLRGLHYQLKHPQGKLIYAVTGSIFDVAVDIRLGSPTFGQWTGAKLSAADKQQIYIPEGFAHGFVVLSESADVIYKCTDLYAPGDEYGILWSDPAIGINWPVDSPVLSRKDLENPELKKIPRTCLPIWHR
ncbi:MAG: dTDP-4-dehydrorhamnose 3,5-epimerase [Desulfobacteraceae bacterium]|nr:dTDP-4-dehydrorhamnose 3,5-epimerase [Desulfobacteraceae bacterium]MBC2754968.1 dTDP-4-dehydrorhamnose 3,5-epimerase [Desulfobacteraceae bacterium]